MRKKGFTLTEIIIAMVILAAVMTGLTNIFVSGSRYLLHSRSRMSSAELGKLFLDPLQNDVRQDTLVTGNNLTDAGGPGMQQEYLDGIYYNATYAITNVTAGKKVKLTINWDEPSPF